jgi:hypothetical protein
VLIIKVVAFYIVTLYIYIYIYIYIYSFVVGYNSEGACPFFTVEVYRFRMVM